jgi:hypothetical protein
LGHSFLHSRNTPKESKGFFFYLYEIKDYYEAKLLEQGVFGVAFASSKSICFICKVKGGVYALGAFAFARSKSKCFFLFIPLNVNKCGLKIKFYIYIYLVSEMVVAKKMKLSTFLIINFEKLT